MEMLELLNPNDFSKFYLRADLVEKVLPARGSCSEILTTTGRWVHCVQSPEEVAKMVRAVQPPALPE